MNAPPTAMAQASLPDTKACSPWIDWPGGSASPFGNVAVEVRCRDGFTATGDACEFDPASWVHEGSKSDIVAYREIKPAGEDNTPHDNASSDQRALQLIENALAFYADPKRYRYGTENGAGSLFFDAGRTASVALDELKDLIGDGKDAFRHDEAASEDGEDAEHPLQVLFDAFRTTESCGRDRHYVMAFHFRSLAELHAADDAWRNLRSVPPVGPTHRGSSPDKVSETVTPKDYRGWAISWDYGRFTATSPNYDASYDGQEDGWVDNGQRVTARTLTALRDEVDAFIAEQENHCRAGCQIDAGHSGSCENPDGPVNQAPDAPKPRGEA